MAKYKCSVCGYIYDEEKEGKPFSELTECPVCKQPVSEFHKVEDDNPVVRNYRYMKEIQQMAATGEPIIEAMGTGMPMPGWDDILILGAQLNPAPLDEHADVDITTVIGKHAKKPMVLSGPVYISHMSFGALSKEAKVALAKGSAMAKTAMCSGKDVISPSKFSFINSKEDLKEVVEGLRIGSEGRPIGIKIAAGHIERDLEWCVYAEPDFITIDGRGGATGASPRIIRDATSVPTIYALHRARKYLDSVGSDIDLVITGGLRVSSDFAKAIAMGATAVAIASAAMVSLACKQYRICGSGRCPVGIATQDAKLRENLKVEEGAKRVYNYLNCSFEELKTFARITGHENIHELSVDDLVTINSEISEHTDILHA